MRINEKIEITSNYEFKKIERFDITEIILSKKISFYKKLRTNSLPKYPPTEDKRSSKTRPIETRIHAEQLNLGFLATVKI